MKGVLWIKFTALVLASCVMAMPPGYGSVVQPGYGSVIQPGYGSVIQRVNLGVLFMDEGTDRAGEAVHWQHVVRLPLPRERGEAQVREGLDQVREGLCQHGVDTALCQMDLMLALQSTHLAAWVDKDIALTACAVKQMLPRLPQNLTFDSSSELPVLGDAFGRSLAGPEIYRGSNLTQLNATSSIFRVLTVGTLVTQAASARLNVALYREAAAALARGTLQSQLLDRRTVENITLSVQRLARARGLEHRVDVTSIEALYSKLWVRAYVDDDYLYICLPIRLVTVPQPTYQVFRVSTFPVAAGPHTRYATQVAGLPDIFLLHTREPVYSTTSSDTWARCLRGDPHDCYTQLVRRPLSESSCVLGVYRDDAEMVRDACRFDLVQRGSESSVQQLIPGLVLVDNAPTHLLDCPKRHPVQTSVALPPCTQCIHYVPCECALRVGGQHFPPLPCSRNSRPLCREALESHGELPGFAPANQTEGVSVSGGCQFGNGSSTWTMHPVNMALWMIAGQTNTQLLRGSTLFSNETDLHLPGLGGIFQRWEGRVRRMRLQGRNRTGPEDSSVEGKPLSVSDTILLVASVTFAAFTVIMFVFIFWGTRALTNHYHKKVSEQLEGANPIILL